MLKEHKKKFNRLFRAADLTIILVSFFLAYYIRFGFPPFYTDLPKQYQVFFPAYLIAWFYLSYYLHLYKGRRIGSFLTEAWDVAKTVGLCLILAEVVGFFLRDYPLSRLFLIHLWIIQTSALFLFRLSLRQSLKYIRKQGYNFRNILIVGRNDRANAFLTRIKGSPELGLQVLGFIDGPNGSHPQPQEAVPLGDLNDLENILRNEVVDEIFVFLPIKSFYSEIEKVLRICEKAGIEAKIPIDLFSHSFAKATMSIYADTPVIELYTSTKMNFQLFIKRLLDILISAFLLFISIPIFLVCGILIKITSEGPVFFIQERVGYNGRIFRCLKFRTMLNNSEHLKKALAKYNEMDGPVFKMKNDPRVTKLGRFLRKASIDELPQFINVLVGDMSLVGPRPPIPAEVNQYDLEARRKLSMKPGITCLWQVNGRNKINFERWMELDKNYIDNWSLMLDLKILLKTIPAVLRCSGAG